MLNGCAPSSVTIKRWLKFGTWVAACLFLALLIFLWLSAGRVASPARPELKKHHHSYLDQPAAHGLHISKHFFLSEQVPTLIVRPHPEYAPKERGKLIRHQLNARNIPLSPYGSETGLLVMLHGRQGRKEYLLPIAERYCAAGFICLLPDLPAHGESKLKTLRYGSSDFEKKLPAHVAREAAATLKLSHLPKSIWGMSMGGSFAIHAAAIEPEFWHRAVIISSFDELDGVITDSLKRHISLATPLVKPLLHRMIIKRGGPDIQSIRPIEYISDITAPTLIIHGDNDKLIQNHRGKRLFDALKTSKNYYNVPGAHHGNIFITEAPVFATSAAWLLK